MPRQKPIIIGISMHNKIKIKKAQRRIKTDVNLFEDHLEMKMPDYFDERTVKKQTKIPRNQRECLLSDNNFGITIRNEFAFILLHLRNKTNKNPLNIKIPQVCIFNDKSLYDVVHSQDGYIRGLKQTQQQKLRLRDCYKFFKSRWKTEVGIEQSMACFTTIKDAKQQHVYSMLSDNQLFITCHKIKGDPYFEHLDYIQNRIVIENDSPIKVDFVANVELDLIKIATESLLGFRDEKELAQSLTEDRYLSYLNEKICLYLNYEHNIRVFRAKFHYIKSTHHQYYFTNVTNLDFTNLTPALKRRQKRLEEQIEERNKIILMTPQKYERYKSMEGRPNIKIYEKLMLNKFERIMREMKLNTVSENKREEVKNQLAFKKLHPKSKFTYMQVVTSKNFSKTQQELFNTNSRKPITKPSKYVMQFYNLVSRSATEFVSN